MLRTAEWHHSDLWSVFAAKTIHNTELFTWNCYRSALYPCSKDTLTYTFHCIPFYFNLASTEGAIFNRKEKWLTVIGIELAPKICEASALINELSKSTTRTWLWGLVWLIKISLLKGEEMKLTLFRGFLYVFKLLIKKAMMVFLKTKGRWIFFSTLSHALFNVFRIMLLNFNVFGWCFQLKKKVGGLFNYLSVCHF